MHIIYIYIYTLYFFIINFMWYKVYSCNLLLPSLRNLENRLEIKLIVFVLLANSDTYIKEKKLVQLQTTVLYIII